MAFAFASLAVLVGAVFAGAVLADRHTRRREP